MMKIDLRDYARLIVRSGANVQPGQKVRLTACVDQEELAAAVALECYEAGAKYVEVLWESEKMSRLHYLHADAETLGTVLPWEEARAKQMAEDLPVRIFIDSEDPDALSGLSPELLAKVGAMRSSVLKKYRDEIDGKHQWVIAAAASPAWAKKVFPDEPDDRAVQKLWELIFSCTRMDAPEGPVKAWADHVAKIKARVAYLNEQHFVKLHLKSANGTDFTVGMIPGAKWQGAGDVNPLNGAFYLPNLPTEEIFISPMRGVCEGRLVATKPLSYSGQLIENFSVDYRNGRVADCHAERGEEALRKMFAMDEGASMLGEVALVPKESPINRSGVLFYNTLFDENAVCHVAAGIGFAEVLDDYLNMSKEEQTAHGINDSMIHVDFMVGAEDTEIIGYRVDGSSEKIFENGTFAGALK
ncbi:MAG: aminopeptidase [Clostridia bacterium]|nr:aminopeptidase [Clostridia bacterium]